MPKISDTDALILSNASRRDGMSILPAPASFRDGASIAKNLASLSKRKLIVEREVAEVSQAYRYEDGRHIGLFVTAAGLAAIGVTVEGENEIPADPVVERSKTKRDAIIALMSRSEGATLPELIASTQWLPHTTRAALTGLRKKGYTLTRGKRFGATCYTIVSSPMA